ncbi:RraA family protein [Dactylosporangium sp. CA-152071]|uniref:RraA family protein n=1 Tax=Dactylosporangium sp. CA-152071 TaxID=3239933 RepID=UPI003D8CBCCD
MTHENSPAVPTEEVARIELVRDMLYTPVIGDVLDQIGRRHQILPPRIRPLRADMRLVGRAMPVLVADAFGPQARPFGRLTEALDQLRPHDVYLARTGRLECAAWGELLTATARVRGAAGAVIDGYHRDTPRVLAQQWPVFSRGAYAQDAAVRAQVVDYRVPVEFGAVAVRPGDLVVADVDGVVIVPAELEDEVLELALAKATSENTVRAAIEGGMSSTEALATFGVL